MRSDYEEYTDFDADAPLVGRGVGNADEDDEGSEYNEDSIEEE